VSPSSPTGLEVASSQNLRYRSSPGQSSVKRCVGLAVEHRSERLDPYLRLLFPAHVATGYVRISLVCVFGFTTE
jgi:hypothetical protein